MLRLAVAQAQASAPATGCTLTDGVPRPTPAKPHPLTGTAYTQANAPCRGAGSGYCAQVTNVLIPRSRALLSTASACPSHYADQGPCIHNRDRSPFPAGGCNHIKYLQQLCRPSTYTAGKTHTGREWGSWPWKAERTSVRRGALLRRGQGRCPTVANQVNPLQPTHLSAAFPALPTCHTELRTPHPPPLHRQP